MVVVTLSVHCWLSSYLTPIVLWHIETAEGRRANSKCGKGYKPSKPVWRAWKHPGTVNTLYSVHTYTHIHVHTHTFSAVIRHIILNVADFQCVRKLLQNTWRPSVWPFHDSTSSPPLTSWTSSPMAISPLWYDYLHTMCTATLPIVTCTTQDVIIPFVLMLPTMWFLPDQKLTIYIYYVLC